MKMLICTYFFSPQNEIAAIRLSKLVKYLVRANWDVDIICFKPNKHMPLESLVDRTLECKEIEKCNIVRLSQPLISSFLYGLSSLLPKRKKRSMRPLMSDNGNMITVPRTSSFVYVKDWIIGYFQYQKYIRQLKKQKNIKYDICLSSFGPMSSLLICKSLKKLYPLSSIVVDFRDPFIRQSDLKNEFVLRNKEQILHMVKENVDQVIAVSDGCIYQNIIDLKNVRILSNGFDIEDRNRIEKKKFSETDGKLHIFYGGRVYYYYKTDLIAQSLSVLPKSISENIVIHYAGKDFESFSKPFLHYNVESVLDYCGILTRDKVLEYQEKSDFLLCMTWNTDRIKGVVTAKVLEYLSAQVPIICLISGNEGGGATEQIIRDCRVGVCFNSYDQNGVKELADFLVKYCGQKYDYSPDLGKLNFYSYEMIANRFSYIVNESSMANRKD